MYFIILRKKLLIQVHVCYNKDIHLISIKILIETTHLPVRVSYKNFASTVYEYIRTRDEVDAFNEKVNRLSIDMSTIEVVELK